MDNKQKYHDSINYGEDYHFDMTASNAIAYTVFAMGCVTFCGVLFWMYSASGSEKLAVLIRPPVPKYTFEAVTLPNDDSCFIVRGGTHSGYIGITCNYSKTNKQVNKDDQQTPN